MINTNFPLKVICPHCKAAIGAKCRIEKYSLGSTGEQVRWFHFARTDNAILNGFDQHVSPGIDYAAKETS